MLQEAALPSRCPPVIRPNLDSVIQPAWRVKNQVLNGELFLPTPWNAIANSGPRPVNTQTTNRI